MSEKLNLLSLKLTIQATLPKLQREARVNERLEHARQQAKENCRIPFKIPDYTGKNDN